jgi:ferritin
MLSAAMEDALNSQLNAELYSSYLYLSMCAQQQASKMNGIANWLGVQAKEELGHAVRFFDYVNQAGGRIQLRQIDGPPLQWASPLAVFEHVLQHEKRVTALINGLVEIAQSEGDQVTYQFLQWFVSEQLEEEESAEHVVNLLTVVGADSALVLQADAELALRR